MTAALRTLILDTHNTLRNRIALGQQPGFSTARRMAQMVWNNDLQFLAQLNTRSCQMAHDACMNTRKKIEIKFSFVILFMLRYFRCFSFCWTKLGSKKYFKQFSSTRQYDFQYH